ncbi:TPA: hypothetical protein L1311_001210 [Escherichia coli]|nr:hypothetical protein [Escherichia coli]
MQPSPAMQNIIAHAWEIFHFYPAPQQFNICVPCCVSEEMAQALRQTPLRQLTVEMIYEWNSSARPFEQQNDEIRYLLPRLLELLAHGHCPAINEELCLKRIGAISLDIWHPEERDVLTDFSRQYIHDLLLTPTLTDLESAFVMFHFAGLPITALLDEALNTGGYWSIASLAYFLYIKRPNGELRNAFISRKPDGEVITQQINAWITQSCHALAERAAAAIECSPSLPGGGHTEYSVDLSYLIDESLCALVDYQLLWTMDRNE